MGNYFSESAARERRQREATEDRQASIADFDRLCALVLGTPPGRELLAHMRKAVIDRPPDARTDSESALRAHIAEVQFVLHIEGATERGLAAMAKGKSA